MPQRMEIEGGVARTIEYTIASEVALAELLKHVERTPKVTTPVLPASTKLLSWDESNPRLKTLEVLLELPPATRGIRFRGNQGTATHQVMLPWTYFRFIASTGRADDRGWELGTYQAFWSKTRINNLATARLLVAKLPNVYEDGRICFGSTAADSTLPLGDRLDTIVNGFYVSDFNRDLTIRRPGGYRNFAAWVAATNRNPNGWVDWEDWTEARLATDILSTSMVDAPQIVLQGTIPTYVNGLTFGAAEDWLRRLDPNDRIRLRSALANIEVETPEAMTAVAEATALDDED